MSLDLRELLREWLDEYGGSTFDGRKACTPQLEERTRAVLAQPPSAAGEGMVLVPIEPTDEMLNRLEGIDSSEPDCEGITWQEWQRRRWKWIISVAPSAMGGEEGK